VRTADRPAMDMPGPGSATIVDGGEARDVRILEVTTPAGERTGLHAHAGEEHHIVLDGTWRMAQGEHVVELGGGDYLAWVARIPHDVECLTGTPERMLIVYARRGGR